MDIQELKNKIQTKDVEGNKTYLWIKIAGRKYGQSYQNTVNTIEGMKNDFIVFYYPMILEDLGKDEMSVTWCVDDVKSIAEDLTDEECREVLRLAKEEHDATIGINWDVLEHWASEVRSNRVSA